MTRLTKQQRQAIVRTFAAGESTLVLAIYYKVPIARIESIIREAMKGTHATVTIKTQGAAVIPPILIYDEEL
jgi:hypothetical protein